MVQSGCGSLFDNQRVPISMEDKSRLMPFVGIGCPFDTPGCVEEAGEWFWMASSKCTNARTGLPGRTANRIDLRPDVLATGPYSSLLFLCERCPVSEPVFPFLFTVDGVLNLVARR